MRSRSSVRQFIRRYPLSLAVCVLSVCVLPAVRPTEASPGAQLSPDDTLRTVVAADPVPRDLALLSRQYLGLGSPPRVVNFEAPGYSRGRTDTFWIARQRPPEHFQVEAELQHVGRRAYWYVQRGFQVSEAELVRSAEVFDDHIYPLVRRLIGSEAFPGIDNDPRITIFNGETPGVAGYVSSSDAYPRSVHPYSNEREIVYLNMRALEVGRQTYLATLAHEFTHLVHWNVHAAEDTWIKEGLAEVVSSLLFPSRRPASLSHAAMPDLQLTSWSDGEPGSAPVTAHYEAASWFLRYLVDRFGDEALFSLVTRDTRGTASVQGLLAERGLTFGEIYDDWLVANVVQSPAGSAVPTYVSIHPEPPVIQRANGPEAIEASVAQFGADYYELPLSPALDVEFAGASTVPLIAASPYKGEAMWYGGSADSSTATLTRRFDLAGLQNAELSFSAWYDLERGYDFAYVSVSTDEGRTWTLLEGPGMSRPNPTGNNLGIGYTGQSGGFRPQWLRESIDISPFVGGPMWLRFSHITDDTIVREGVAIDDIMIEPLGYADGAEDATDWHGEGWARVGATLPQHWSMQVIEWIQGTPSVARIPVDAGGRAAWSARGRQLDRAVLIVSATTPVTLQRASYSLNIRMED